MRTWLTKRVLPPLLAAGVVSCAAVLALARGGLTVSAQDDKPPGDPISFTADIRPIITNRCFKCHGPDDGAREAGLRLDSRDTATATTASGVTPIAPGDLINSEIIRRITSADPDVRMPPPEVGDALSSHEIDLLTQWIADGAIWEKHWSFVAPKRPALPEVADATWPLSAIDRFVLAELDRRQLTPAADANRHTLIRRLTLDLTGLGPTPEAVAEFVNDDSPQAYDALIERVLASPAFGERWASVWLDQARYADTKGYEADRHRTIWPYRDWVIRAFNDDQPFDAFTIEQIAGDLLPEASRDQQLATAFHRNTMNNDEGGTDDEEFRVAAVIDRVNTTMQVWMGLTMGCSQCHSHKYDPITHREYYEFFAFFNQTEDADRMDEAPTMRIVSGEQESRLAALTEQLDVTQEEIAARIDAIEYDDPGLSPGDDQQSLSQPQEFVWIDDRAPVGAIQQQTGGPAPWQWASSAEAPVHSGSRAAWFEAGGFGQFFVTEALAPLVVGEGDQLFAHVYLDPDNPPREIMLQFHSKRASWGHRVYWGENLIGFGADKTHERRPAGELPETGVWHRLSVSAADVGLHVGDEINGWAFSQHGGRVTWDSAGIVTSAQQDDLYLTSLATWETRVKATSFTRMPQDVRDALAVGQDVRTLAQQRTIRNYYLQHVHDSAWRELESYTTAQREIEQQMAAIKNAAPTAPIMRELSGEKRRTTHVLTRGSFLNPAEEVTPGTPAALHSIRAITQIPQIPHDAPNSRLTLARWLVAKENPLTARVTVNRIWSRMFGAGLVLTEEDFGIQGMLPSHPELLDYLAVEFMESGWSFKDLCRLIVSSRTYRQAAIVTPRKLEVDPYNTWLSRGARYRLPAEMVRDQALAAAGLLSEKMYGPSVYPAQPDGVWSIVYNNSSWTTSAGEDQHRRALYTYWRRTSPYPSMINFDTPSREFCVPRRIRTNTPLQAFTTLNDPVYVQCAQALARRIVDESAATAAERAQYMLELCLCRPVSAFEVDRLVELYHAQHAAFTDRADEARQLATGTLGPLADEADPVELAAWTVVANVVLNLDEFLSHP